MSLVDTHCHIHSADYQLDAEAVIAEAVKDGVDKMICVGTNLKDSVEAVRFVKNHQNCWASIGLHPHEAKDYLADPGALAKFESLTDKPKVVAVGECGLDYFYNHSPPEAQKEALHLQIEIAQKYDLPLIFHVREAFDDFFEIFDKYRGLRGVIHSFTASRSVMEKALSRDLFLGLNGIMTFTKDAEQLAMAKAVPLNKLLLETDAPFLTPDPYRGTICQPKHVGVTARFLSEQRSENLSELAAATTQNALKLFNLK